MYIAMMITKKETKILFRKKMSIAYLKYEFIYLYYY